MLAFFWLNFVVSHRLTVNKEPGINNFDALSLKQNVQQLAETPNLDQRVHHFKQV